MKKLIGSVLLTLVAVPAFAGGTWTGVTVSNVEAFSSEGVSPNGYIEVLLSGNSTGGPSCSSSNKAYVIIDVSQPGGSFAAAIMQSARLSGATVNVGGAGTCGFNSGVETLSYVSE